MNSSIGSSVNVNDLMKNSAKKSAEICISLLDKNHINGQEILKFWSTKLLNYYGLLECNNEIIELLLNSILLNLKKVLRKQNEDENLKNKTILEYIAQWCNVYAWIRIKIADFNLYRLSTFIESSLKTLETILLYSTQRISNENNEIFKESLQLQEVISAIILENFNIFICQGESCMESIIKLTKLHCDVVKYISKLDIKTAVNVWKLILKLSIENAEYYKNNVEIDFQWLRTPVVLLCDQINNSVKQIYISDDESLDKLERILKINSFLIKCLEKFAIEFEHNYFHGCSELFETICLILNIPKKFKQTKKQDLITQYLVVGILNLIKSIYKNDRFINKLLDHETFATADECANICVIIIEILKMLCLNADNDTVNLYLDKHIMEKLFRNIRHSRELFLNKNKRDELIGIVSSLFLQHYRSVKVMRLFENLISNGVLHNDFLLANICIDICLVVVRFIHADKRYKYFKFWISINEKFPIFSESLQSVYVEYLITSLYEILPNNYKSEFWSTYFSVDIENDKRSLLTLGINRIFDKSQQTIHKNKLQAELHRKIQSNFEQSLENYYRVVEIMKLLCDTDIDNTFLSDSLLHFWPLLSMDLNLQTHDLFFRTLFKCCAKNINIFNDKQIQAIFTLIEKYGRVIKSSDNVILNLQLYDFLSDVIKNKPLFKDKGNSLQILLRNNPENKLIEYLRLDHLSPIPSTSKDIVNSEKYSEKYSENQFHVDFEHICKISDDQTSPNRAKKIRLDGGREIVKEALQSAEKIQQYFKYEKPNSMDIENMNEIIKIYGGIINKS